MSKQTEEDSKGEKLAGRIAQILAQLYQGRALDKHDMAAEFQVGVRTIERDLQRLSKHVERDGGKWKLRHSAEGVVKSDLIYEYARMVGTDKLFPNSSTDYLIAQAKQGEGQRVTHVKATSSVDLEPRNTEVFEPLETACMKLQVCTFMHNGKARRVEPYKLVHHNGVWYLAADDGEKLKMFSLERISGLKVQTGEVFKPKKEHLLYIDAQKDVWFTGEVIEVMLRVSSEAAHYFERRALLPEQQTIRRDDDGSVVIRAKINHKQQVLPVVRYWLPHVRIIEPKAWHAELVDGLKAALDKWGES